MKSFAIGTQSLLASALVAAFALTAATSRDALADRTNRPLDVIDSGQLKVDLNLEITLNSDNFFNPVALAPDIYYGINNDFSIGLVHSAASQGLMGVGRSIALGDNNAYDSVGLEAAYALLRRSSLSLAAQGGFFFDRFDPSTRSSLKLGGIVRTTLGPLEATINPYIRLPLNDSGEPGVGTDVFVPVWLYYGLNNRLDLAIITGLNDEAMQLGGGVSYNLEGPIDLGAHIGWPRIAGEASDGGNLAMRLYASFEI